MNTTISAAPTAAYAYYCCECGGSVELVNEKRATFSCQKCPANGGHTKRYARACTSASRKTQLSAAHAIQLQLTGEPLPGISDVGAGANTPRDSGASNFDTAAHTLQLPRTTSSAQLTRTFSSAFSVIEPGGGHAAPATSASTPAMKTSASASSISHQPTKPPTRKRSSLAIADMAMEGDAQPEEWQESPLSMLCAAALPLGGSASPARGGAGAVASTGARGKGISAAAKAAAASKAVATGMDTDEEREAKRLRRVQANRESARNTIRRKKAQYEQLSMRAAQLDAENAEMKQQREELLTTFQKLQAETAALVMERDRLAMARRAKGLPPVELEPQSTVQFSTHGSAQGSATDLRSLEVTSTPAAEGTGEAPTKSLPRVSSHPMGMPAHMLGAYAMPYNMWPPGVMWPPYMMHAQQPAHVPPSSQ